MNTTGFLTNLDEPPDEAVAELLKQLEDRRRVWTERPAPKGGEWPVTGLR
jgi:hypothetical protein